jgi:hypothetical protein
LEGTSITLRTSNRQSEISASFKKAFSNRHPPDYSIYKEFYNESDFDTEIPEEPLWNMGRIAIVCVDDGALCSLHFQLPDSLRADNPEDTDTICWIIASGGEAIYITIGTREFHLDPLCRMEEPVLRQFVGKLRPSKAWNLSTCPAGWADPFFFSAA